MHHVPPGRPRSARALALMALTAGAVACADYIARPGDTRAGNPDRAFRMGRPVLDLYDVWDEELQRMTTTGARETDVSALLGAAPHTCERAPDRTPTVGLDLVGSPTGSPVVAAVQPRGPAARAGLAEGMVVTGVAGQAVETLADAVRRVREEARVGSTLVVTTEARQYDIDVVRRDRMLGDRKCYWRVGHGSVGAASRASIDTLGDGGAGDGYQVACRFADGVLTVCRSAHPDDDHGHSH